MSSGTTASGTAFTGFGATMADGSGARRFLANDKIGVSGLPFLIYFHGAGSNGNFFESASVFFGIRDKLIDAGWVCIESNGGPTNAEGQQNWGNEESRTAYTLAFEWADGIHNLGQGAVLGRSMGGINGHYFGTRHPTIAPRVDAIIINSGVCNLLASNMVGENGTAIPGTSPVQYSGSGKFWPTMWTAHDVADAPAFAAAVSPEYDPHQFDPSVFDGVNIQQLVGTADYTVPMADHGLAMRTRYSGRPAIDSVVIGDGKSHASSNGMYDYTDDMWAFLLEAMPGSVGPVDPPADPVIHKRLKSYLWDGQDSYELTPRA